MEEMNVKKMMIKRTICAVACTAVALTAVMADFLMAQTEVVQAAEKEPIQVGDNVYATLDDYGTLTISGTGEMWENNHNDIYRVRMQGNDVLYAWPYDIKYSSDVEDFCPWFGEYEDELNSVVFQEGVTTVGSHAFSVCNSKKWFSGSPSSYAHMGHRGLSALTSVTLGSTVNTIGEGAFYDTPALKSINIPGNVKSIEQCAFLYSGLTSVKLNEGLENIGEYAFAETKLTGVNIPGTVKSIESNAFLNSSLSNVTINKGTKIIKKNAFPAVSVKFYSKDVVIMEGAFGNWSSFTCYKGSSADKYAKDHGIRVKYISDKPAKAKKPTVSSKNKKLYVTCKTMAGVDGYKIRYSTNPSMKNADTELGKKVTIVGLNKGKKYYVQVCAYRKDSNGKKVYGAWSDTVSVTIK